MKTTRRPLTLATRTSFLRANLAELRKDLATGTMPEEVRHDLEDTVRVGTRELAEVEFMMRRGVAA